MMPSPTERGTFLLVKEILFQPEEQSQIRQEATRTGSEEASLACSSVAIITLTKYSHVPSHVLLLRSPRNTTNGRTLTTENLLFSYCSRYAAWSICLRKAAGRERIPVLRVFSHIHALQVFVYLFSHTCPWEPH